MVRLSGVFGAERRAPHDPLGLAPPVPPRGAPQGKAGQRDPLCKAHNFFYFF
jgi:hypothetical protein